MSDDPLAWVHLRPMQVPTIIQHWDGLPAITLSKLQDGTVRLLWVFDEDHPQQLGLFVHLTDDEAQIVFDTPPGVGLIERVRLALADTDALLWHADQITMTAGWITIPREGTEEAMWEMIGTELERLPFAVSMRASDRQQQGWDPSPATAAVEGRERTLVAAARLG